MRVMSGVVLHYFHKGGCGARRAAQAPSIDRAPATATLCPRSPQEMVRLDMLCTYVRT